MSDRNIDESIREKYPEEHLKEPNDWIADVVKKQHEFYKSSFEKALDRWIELLQIDGRNTKHQVLMEMKEIRGKIK